MFWKRWGAALDRLPAKAGLPLGIGLGALAGALLLLTPAAVWVPAFLVLFTAAGVLAWSGEPVEALPAPPPRVEPAAPVPDQKTVLASIELVSIPAGRFLIGSPEEEEDHRSNEEPVHEVGISAFLCMKTPVTRRLYADVMGTDPGWPEDDAADRPANIVSWFDAVDFCNRLSEREGFIPCYERAEDEVTWHREANGYRLPTEAEWEYACRAGTNTRWSFGDDEQRLSDHAWFRDNSEGQPRPVGRKQPNPWGLRDMHGNVWEWCWDRYGAYEPAFAQDPAGPPKGRGRVVRGGSFDFPARDLRSAFRNWVRPVLQYWYIGFRCVRVPRRQP